MPFGGSQRRPAVVGPRHIADGQRHLPSGRLRLVGHGLQTVLSPGIENQPRARHRQFDRQRTADAAGGAGDKHAAGLKRSSSHGEVPAMELQEMPRRATGPILSNHARLTDVTQSRLSLHEGSATFAEQKTTMIEDNLSKICEGWDEHCRE